MQQPAVGRIVHYTGILGGDPAPALVLKVHETANGIGVVDLLVWGPNRDDRVRAIPFSADGAPRSWNWPPRV